MTTKPEGSDAPPPVATTSENGTTVTISPSTSVVRRAGRIELTASVEIGEGDDTDEAVVWTTTGGSIEALTAPGTARFTAPSTGGVFYIVAKSVGTPSAQGVAAIEVKAVDVIVTPAKVRVQPGATIQFAAEVRGAALTQVAWSIAEGPGSGGAHGFLDQRGLYTAPETALEGELTIRATSAADPEVRGTAELSVTDDPLVAIALFPSKAVLETGESLKFAAVVTNELETAAVTWRVEAIPGESTGGAVMVDDRLIAGAEPGRFLVRARSVEDGSRSSAAEVGVVTPVRPPLLGRIRAGAGTTILGTDPVQIVEADGQAGSTGRAGTGTFRLRGGNSGEFPLNFLAFVDPGLGRPSFPAPKVGLVTLASEPLPGTVVDFVVSELEPLTEATVAPTGVVAVGNLDGIVVAWGPPSGGCGESVGALCPWPASSIVVEVNTNNTFTGTATTKEIPSGAQRYAYFGGLSTSVTYFVRARAKVGTDYSDWTIVSGGVSTSAPSSGNSVSGNIDLGPLALPAARPVLVVTEPLVAFDAGSTADSLAYSVPGLAPGVHQLLALVDEDNDQAFEASEAVVWDPEVVGIHASNVTGHNIDEAALGVLPRVLVAGGPGGSTDLTLQVLPAHRRLQRAALIRLPTLLAGATHVPIDLGREVATGGHARTLSTVVGGGSAEPTEPLVADFNLTFTDGITHFVQQEIHPPARLDLTSMAVLSATGSPLHYALSLPVASGSPGDDAVALHVHFYKEVDSAWTAVEGSWLPLNATSASGTTTVGAGRHRADVIVYDRYGNQSLERIENPIVPAVTGLSGTATGTPKRFQANWVQMPIHLQGAIAKYRAQFFTVTDDVRTGSALESIETTTASATNLTATTHSVDDGQYDVVLETYDHFGTIVSASHRFNVPGP